MTDVRQQAQGSHGAASAAPVTALVADWATDYDVLDPGYVVAPYGVWDELRSACPVAHTERWGGSFLPTRYPDIAAVALMTSMGSVRAT
jgi:hypothetical protein